jgi:hypothetical protein|tara:strand:- start:99 stop:242 length:144 start_codon:yes stop_codon:yes gene_type:complete
LITYSNLVNITFGRDLAIIFEEKIIKEDMTDISATKIRKEMRDKGTL